MPVIYNTLFFIANFLLPFFCFPNFSQPDCQFDLYYQDVQQRIKDQKYSNADYAHKNKIDLVIVVDMLLTGFDSKYLNTLYVDKNLKHHSLIQAFSRTNRVLNDTKPYGNILDFRQQTKEVDDAIALFSGENNKKAKEIWLVDPAPVVVKKLDNAVKELETFMKTQGLYCTPREVNNLKGDHARGEFINKFKEVQRLKTQLDQYTDLSAEESAKIESLIPENTMREFRSVYIETAGRLKSQQGKGDKGGSTDVDLLDFEFILFSSAILWNIADQLHGAMNTHVVDFEKQMRRKVHYVIEPKYLWSNIYELARTQER